MKRIIALLAGVLFVSCAHAQVAISAQITDSDGINWFGAPWYASLSSGGPTFGGTTDASGNLIDSTDFISGQTYNVTIYPLASVPPQTVNNITISSSAAFQSSMNAGISAPRFNAQPLPTSAYGYSAVEAIGGTVLNAFVNITTGTTLFYDGYDFIQYFGPFQSPPVLNGQIGFSTATSALQGFSAGLVGTYNRTLFISTANSTPITTTAESSLIPTTGNIGTMLLPANYIAPGRKFNVRLSGVYTRSGTDTVTINIYVGGVVVATSGAFTPTGAVSNGEFNLDELITCRTVSGTAATCVIRGNIQLDTATLGTKYTVSIFNGGNTFTVNPTIPNLVDVTWAFSTAAASASANSFSAGFYEDN